MCGSFPKLFDLSSASLEVWERPATPCFSPKRSPGSEVVDRSNGTFPSLIVEP